MTKCVRLALALLLPAASHAQLFQPLGAELRVNSYTTGDQLRPVVGVLPSDDFLVTWVSFGSLGSDQALWSTQARRFAASGAAVAGDFQVNTYTTDFQIEPDVAVQANGDFIIVWQSFGAVGDSDWSVQGQRFASAGAPLASQFRVNATTADQQTNPKVETFQNGDFVVVWQSGAPGLVDVLGRRFSSAGANLGSEFQVNTYTTSQQSEPDVAATGPSGDFVVVWESFGSSSGDASQFGVVAQRFSSAGTRLGTDFQVNTYSTSYQRVPRVDSHPSAGFVVVWHSYGAANGDDRWSVQSRRFASSGAPLGGQVQVNELSLSDQDFPTVAFAPDGGFAVAWMSYGSSDTDTDRFSIQARRYGSTGSALAGEFQVNTSTTDDQSSPDVAFFPSGELVIAWEGSDPTPLTEGLPTARIHARRFGVDCLFMDRFESGGFLAWSVATHDSGDLAVVAGAAIEGAFGLRATIDDTNPMFLQDNSPPAVSRYRAGFFLDPNGYTPGANGERIKILQLFSTTPDQRRLVTLVLRSVGGQYRVLAKVRRDDDTLVNSGFHTISDGPHFLDFEWLRSSAPGAGDGLLRFFVDGVMVSELIGLDNDTRPAEFVRLGTLGIKPGTTGSIHFDAFQSCD